MKLRDANLQVYVKKIFTYPPSCILPSFSKNASRLLLPKRLLKCTSKISFRKCKQKLELLAIFLFNYDSSKSTSFVLNVAFSFVVRFGYGFCLVNWKLLQHKNYKNILLFSACVLICSTFR